MKPGIKQISEQTGFSVATVSNALNHKRGVNADTAEKILRVAREIGYLEAGNIRKIRLVIFKKTGEIIDDTPFFPALISGMEQECRKNGFELCISNLDCRQADWKEQVKTTLSDAETALIFLGTELAEEDYWLFQDISSPFILLDYWSDALGASGVVINNEDAVREAVRYLVEHGHREIGYLKGKFRIAGFEQREVSFCQQIEQYGLKPAAMVELTTTMDGAYHAMCRYLASQPDLPTAFFAENDILALGAMRAMKNHGISIPEDVSLIGFDDLPFCEISAPRLTSLRVPKLEMGAIAVRRLIGLIQGGTQQVRTKTLVCTQFVERDSVRTRI